MFSILEEFEKDYDLRGNGMVKFDDVLQKYRALDPEPSSLLPELQHRQRREYAVELTALYHAYRRGFNRGAER